MADTLKEYLIALGFKVDENGWKGFNEKIAHSSRTVANLGATTVAVATEIGVTVEKVARHYEELYYVSQRVGSSVGSLKAYEFGARQIGLSVDAARASTESWAASMRNNPGVRALFQGMGIDTADSKKGIGQLVDVMKSQFGEAGYFIAQRYAGIAGIDESTFRQIWMNREKLRTQEEASARRQKEAGIDAQKYSDDSVRFGDAVRTMEDRWGNLIDRVAIGWLPKATEVVELLESGAAWMIRMDVASKGWLGTIGSIVTALGALKAAGAVLGLAGRLIGLPAAAAATAGRIGAGGVAMRLLGPVGAFAWGMGLGGESKATTIPGGAGKAHPSDAPGAGDLSAAIVRTANNLGIDPMDLATAISYETAGTFDKWKKGPTTQWGEHRGLIQWGKPQRDKYGVTEGMSGDDQMASVEKYLRDAGVQPGMKLMDVYSAINAGRVGRNGASDANNGGAPGTVADKVASMGDHRNNARVFLGDTPLTSQGGGVNVTVSHKTENNISGVSDPKKAASLIDESQKRVNGDIVRNTRSAIQ